MIMGEKSTEYPVALFTDVNFRRVVYWQNADLPGAEYQTINMMNTNLVNSALKGRDLIAIFNKSFQRQRPATNLNDDDDA